MRLGYLFLPRFPVQRRILAQPTLAGKPIILVHEDRGTQRVKFSSGTALKYGITPGMTATAAQALSHLEKLRFVETDEIQALAALGEALLPYAPSFEIDDAEGLWLDASAAHLVHSETGWAERVLTVCRELGLKGHCAVGSEKCTTQAVARFCDVGTNKSPEVQVLPKGGGAIFSRLPLVSLRVDVSEFKYLGLSMVGELASLPPEALVSRFGQRGRILHALSRGHDDALLVKHRLPETIVDAMSFDWPVEQLTQILFALKTLSDRTCARLKGRSLQAIKLTLHLATEHSGNDPSAQIQLSLSRPSSNSKLLVDLFRHRLEELVLREAVAGLTLTVDETCSARSQQLNLGDEPTGDAALEVVLSRLQSHLGEAALFSAQACSQHRPEAAWSMERFSPVDRNETKREVAPADTPEIRARPARLLGVPAQLHAEFEADGLLHTVTVAGRKRRVQSLWGPERLQGGWWSQATFSRDYYRVQVEGVGLLWAFQDGRDGQFYVQGIFD
jgi:protein ImuB